MKIKNIAFSGFAAAILAAGAANAAATDVPAIASQAYVDRQLGSYTTTANLPGFIENELSKEDGPLSTKADSSVVNELSTTVGTLGDTVETLGGTVETLGGTVAGHTEAIDKLPQTIGSAVSEAITSSMTDTDGALKEALAGKVDSSEKTGTISDTTNADSIPTVGAVTAYIEKAVADGIDVNSDQIANNAITTSKIANGNVTSDKLSDELNTKINGAQTADDVAAAIADAISDDDGAIKQALADKVDAQQVDTAIKDYTIPVPQPDCKAISGSCVLSVNTAGDLTWVNVTATDGAQEGTN